MRILFSELRWNRSLFSELVWNISGFSNSFLVASCSSHFGVTLEFSLILSVKLHFRLIHTSSMAQAAPLRRVYPKLSLFHKFGARSLMVTFPEQMCQVDSIALFDQN